MVLRNSRRDADVAVRNRRPAVPARRPYGRAYQFGYRLVALGTERMDFDLGVDARRRESPLLDGSDLGVLGRARVRW